MILKGMIVGYDGTGGPHPAGLMDCMVIPPGVHHGVRNSGSNNVELIWFHDSIEAKGA